MLRFSGLSVVYEGLQALSQVSLEIHEGEFFTIAGPNGAGKTTLLKAIAGGVGTAAGRIEYRGHDVTTTPAHLRAALGMAHVPEGRHIFPSLTVLENLEMGSYRAAARTHRPQSLAEVFALFPVLQQTRARLAGTLSGGEQQMLAIGRALMSRPELLLLDEPSQGLAPLVVEMIFEVIATIRRTRHLSILLVEQRVVEGLELCDRGAVLEIGRIVMEGDRDALLNDERIKSAYLGT